MGNKSITNQMGNFGIRVNLTQFLHQLVQVFFVGLTIGMTRIVIPLMAESEFGIKKNSYLMIITFVASFGLVKGLMNFFAGRLSESIGRKRVLIIGWLTAVPIPWIIFGADHWNWIVFATILLGVNQGLTWSMTQTAKLDIVRKDQRGLTIGLNEFAGYLGVAVAGIATGYLSGSFGSRYALLIFGNIVIITSITLTLLWVKETISWSKEETKIHNGTRKIEINISNHRDSFPDLPENPTTLQVFNVVSFKDRRLFAFSQAGLVEKFVDALIWIFYPLYFYSQGLSVAELSWVVGLYGFVWGFSQLFTGKLADKIGRMRPIIWGMFLCSMGTGMMAFNEGVYYWSLSSVITGFGMALLYPNLSAAVSDIAKPSWRGTAIGIYRFWRDLGYGVGALLLGIVASITGSIPGVFIFVAICMAISGFIVWIFAEETSPILNLEIDLNETENSESKQSVKTEHC